MVRNDFDVVVVGAGPVGLWLASELALAKVNVIVFERRAELVTQSRALAIHGRTLEVFALRGLADRFLSRGRRIPTGHFGGLDTPLDFSVVDARFPFVQLLPQATTESVLEQRVLELGVDVRRATSSRPSSSTKAASLSGAEAVRRHSVFLQAMPSEPMELVREINELRASLDRLRETAAVDPATSMMVDQLAASVGRQEELIEQFKSDNALLHNSLSFFGRFSVRFASSDLGPAISAAAAAMLHLTLDTSSAAAGEVADRLDQVARQAGSSSDPDSVRPLLAHGRLLRDLLPAVDHALKAMLAVPRNQNQDALRAMVLTRQSASRTTARQFRRLLYATSLLLVVVLAYLGLQLRARAKALQRRAAFEHVIAGISMRFINAQPQNIGAEIDRALADMAGCIGCDRAYFVLSGAAPWTHLWCRAGKSFSPGWPENASALAAQLGQSVDGIIHIPRVSRMPSGENKDVCIAAGLGGWGCITHVHKDGNRVALGFDAIDGRCHLTAGELSLLRMALDTIVSAVGRHSMEKERTRLETRLQQARRMVETVGTFTSGMAHNFNNILGGILGHSEVIEEHFGSDARLLRNLRAIRRGAERARDLVDQILTFGRRRDARRRPLSARGFGRRGGVAAECLAAAGDRSGDP